MKSQLRVLAFDDGPFSFTDEKVALVGVLVRLPSYVEAVMVGEVEVDGTDANDVIAKLIQDSRYKGQPKLVMLDGAAVGGFNVVDIDRLSARTGLAYATVTRDRPDMGAVEIALKNNFPDWEQRLAVLERRGPREVDTGHKPVYVDCAGIGFDGAVQIIKKTIVRGAIPEPLRIAHLIATAMAKGESRGRA